MDARERAAQLWSSDWDDVNPDNPDFDNAWIDKVATAIRAAEAEAAEKARRDALEEAVAYLTQAATTLVCKCEFEKSAQASLYASAIRSLASSPGEKP